MLIDLSIPQYRMGDGDRRGLVQGTEIDAGDQKAIRRLMSDLLIRTLVASKYPQGIDGRDGRRWARIIERLLDQTAVIDLTDDDFDWLCRIVCDDEIRIPAGFAQCRLALFEYFEHLKLEKRQQI